MCKNRYRAELIVHFSVPPADKERQARTVAFNMRRQREHGTKGRAIPFTKIKLASAWALVYRYTRLKTVVF